MSTPKQSKPLSDREIFKSMFGRWPTLDEEYDFVERLGILCGSTSPTRQQVEIATNQIRESSQLKEIYR